MGKLIIEIIRSLVTSFYELYRYRNIIIITGCYP